MVIPVIGLVVLPGGDPVRIAAPGWYDATAAHRREGTRKGICSVAAVAGFALIIRDFGQPFAESGVNRMPTFGRYPGASGRPRPALALAVSSAVPTGDMRLFARRPLLIGAALVAFAHLLVNGARAMDLLFSPIRCGAPFRHLHESAFGVSPTV